MRLDAAAIALRERIEELEEENRQLRALRLPSTVPYSGFGFTGTERIVFAALMAGDRICSTDYLLDCVMLSSTTKSAMQPKTITIIIHRLRKNLRGMGFPGVIETDWGLGWRIRAVNRDHLTRVLATGRVP